jgi:signal transduction histidine kinase
LDSDQRPIRIDVVDTGIGIPPSKLKAVFEPFEQAHVNELREQEGTGLGLTVSRSLCQLMGYNLVVRSELGKGSTFSIHLKPETPTN